jgi:hypothetical protein
MKSRLRFILCLLFHGATEHRGGYRCTRRCNPIRKHERAKTEAPLFDLGKAQIENLDASELGLSAFEQSAVKK